MCGIVGYIGQREAEPILVEGLRRLEYRGYDSAGMATADRARICICASAAGRIAELASSSHDHPAPGCVGISHTRWATHGPANDRNAHPHLGGDGWSPSSTTASSRTTPSQAPAPGRRRALPQRHRYRSHRPAHRPASINGDLVDAGPQGASPLLKGTYGLAVVSPQQPGVLVGARLGSPLVVGIGDGRALPGQRPDAPWSATREKVVYLHDRQMCVLTARRLAAPRRRSRPRRRHRARHRLGRRATPTRALSSTTCSRRFTSSPKRSKTPCAAGSTTPTPRAHFGGLNLDPAATPPGRAHHPDRLRHQLSRRPRRRISVRGIRPHSGRSGVRQRVPLSQSADRAQHDRPRHHAVGRDRRHAGRPARIEAQGAHDARPLQRRRQHASPARPTAASTCTPARRSASPAPRRSPTRSPC